MSKGFAIRPSVAAVSAALATLCLLFGCGNSEKTAYVRNQAVFEAFQGRADVERKMIELQDMHRETLDSMRSSLNLAAASQATEPQVLERGRQAFVQAQREYSEEEAEQSRAYTAQVWQQINEYVNQYGKEHEYDYIFGATGNGTIMHADPSRDVTEEVIEYVNQKYEGR